jgi:hypothetical protein
MPAWAFDVNPPLAWGLAMVINLLQRPWWKEKGADRLPLLISLRGIGP